MRKPSRGCGATPSPRQFCSCSAFPPCSSRSAPAPAPSAGCCGSIRDRWRRLPASASSSWACTFSDLTPIAWLMREKRLEMAKPVGLWGAYLMGFAFALGLDAVHRTDPCRHSCGGRLASDARQGRRSARRLFARPWRAVFGRGVRGRAIRGLSRPLPRPSRPGREGDGRPPRADRHRLSHRHASARRASGCCRLSRRSARSADQFVGAPGNST